MVAWSSTEGRRSVSRMFSIATLGDLVMDVAGRTSVSRMLSIATLGDLVMDVAGSAHVSFIYLVTGGVHL